MSTIIPKTFSAKDVQRDYRKIFNMAKESGKPVIVLTNNKPDVAILGIPELEKLSSQAQKAELIEAMGAIEDYKKQKKLGKLKL